MLNIKWYMISCLTTMLILASGCSGHTSSDTESTEVQGDVAAANETENISGLPEQKPEPVKEEKKGYTFNSVEELKTFMQTSKDAAAYNAGIIPTVADASLSYATKLINNTYKYFVVVDKDKMKVILFDKFGRVVKEYGMAGSRSYGTKHGKGDCRTPEGFFSAEGTYDSSQWHYITDEGVVTPGYPFGPKFIRVKNPVTTGVGIHGTSSPGSIGRRVSHGCIRLHNSSILELVKYVVPGTPIIILPGPTDRAVNAKEGYNTIYFDTGVQPLAGATRQNKAVENKNKKKPENSNEPAQTEENVQPEEGATPATTTEEPEKTEEQPVSPVKKEEPVKTEPTIPE